MRSFFVSVVGRFGKKRRQIPNIIKHSPQQMRNTSKGVEKWSIKLISRNR
jgi:hypothetical protein